MRRAAMIHTQVLSLFNLLNLTTAIDNRREIMKKKRALKEQQTRTLAPIETVS